MPHPTRADAQAAVTAAELATVNQPPANVPAAPPVSQPTPAPAPAAPAADEASGYVSILGNEQDASRLAPSDDGGLTIDPEKADDNKYLTDRLKTVDGMLKANNEQHTAQIAAMMGHFGELVQQQGEQITALRTAKEPEPVAEALPPLKTSFTDDDVKAVFSDEEIEGYGMPALKFQMKREAQTVHAIRTEMHTNMAKQNTENASELFWNGVRATVPDAEAINNDPKYKRYLATTVDPTTGLSLKDSIDFAASRGNSGAVAASMTKFKESLGKPVTPSPSAQTPVPEGRRTVAGGGIAKGPQMIKASEIAQFLDARNYAADPRPDAVKRQIRAEISRAMIEGRVDPNA